MNEQPDSEKSNYEKSSMNAFRNSRAILTELHEIRRRISHISETFEAEENASNVEHKMIGYKMSHVHSKMCEYEDATGERDEILQELSQSFTDRMKRFMFDGESSAAVLANTVIPEDLLDDLMNHTFSSEYDYAMKVNAKLIEVLKCFAKSDVEQLAKFVQVLKNAQGLELEEKMMKLAGFFSKVPLHVQRELLNKLKGEKHEEKLQAMKWNYSSQLKNKSKLPAMQSDEHTDELEEPIQVSVFAKVSSSQPQSHASVVPEAAEATPHKQTKTGPAQSSELKNKTTKQTSSEFSIYHQYLNKLNQKVLEEAKLQSKDVEEIQKILEKYVFTWHPKKNDPSVGSNKTDHLLHSAKQLEKDLKVYFRGKKNKWLSDMVGKVIASLPSSMKKKSKTVLRKSKEKPKLEIDPLMSLTFGGESFPKERNVSNLQESKNKPDDNSKQKAQIHCPPKTSPRARYRPSRQKIHGESRNTEKMWTNYAQIQIDTHVDTIESNETILLKEGSLQEALFNTAYPQLLVPVLPRYKAWSSWSVDRQPSYPGQWRHRQHNPNSRTQPNNMPRFIKGRKIISKTVIPQINSNHTIDLHLRGKQPQITSKRAEVTGPQVNPRKEPIHLPKIAMFPDSSVKRERPTAVTSKLPLVFKQTQMYQ